ncbi:MAG: PRD domain-containing protein [Erysipelotrichaceae bacterium]|nr:PRD domain-containing protein [Erysipelotrichaceae bacterium]
MYRVKKVINNNALLIIDESTNQEVIFMGNGVGFNRKPDELVDNIKDCKRYFMNNGIKDGKDLIDSEYLEIASLILDKTEEKFGYVDRSIQTSLADHIAFTIERIKNNMIISNPFTKDISLLYSDEHEIALKGREIIEEKTGIVINDDEVGYITLHVHSSLDCDSVSESMKTTVIINEALESLEKLCKINIDKDSLSYSRLLIHLKYMFARLSKGERLNIDMDSYVSANFPSSYEVAKIICNSIKNSCDFDIPFTEIGYLAIHIERIKNDGLNFSLKE